MTLKNEFYAQFKEYSIAEINLAIARCDLSLKRKLELVWGVDSTVKIWTNNARDLVRRVKAVLLGMLYKRDVMLEFPGFSRKEVLEELSKLRGETLKNLKKEYSFSGVLERKIDPVNGEIYTLLESEKHRNKSAIYRVRKNLGLCGKKTYPHKDFFSLFDAPKELVIRVVKTLPDSDQALLIKKYGKDFTKTYAPKLTEEEKEDINTRIIKKIKIKLRDLGNDKIFFTLIDLFPGERLEDIEKAIRELKKKDQDKFVSIFGEDLKGELILGRNKAPSLISKHLKKRVLNKLYPEVKEKPIKPLTEVLKNLKKENETEKEFIERIKEAIPNLRDELQVLLYKKFGSDLRKTHKFGELTESEEFDVHHKVVPLLKYYISKVPRVRKYKGLIKRFDAFTTYDELIEEISHLSLEEINLLKKAYGESFVSPITIDVLSKEEHTKVNKIINKLRTKLRKRRKKENGVKIRNLRAIKSLMSTKAYKKLLKMYSPQLSLAILVKVYMDEVSDHELVLLSGVDLNTILSGTKTYLELLQNEKIDAPLLKLTNK